MALLPRSSQTLYQTLNRQKSRNTPKTTAPTNPNPPWEGFLGLGASLQDRRRSSNGAPAAAPGGADGDGGGGPRGDPGALAAEVAALREQGATHVKERAALKSILDDKVRALIADVGHSVAELPIEVRARCNPKPGYILSLKVDPGRQVRALIADVGHSIAEPPIGACARRYPNTLNS